MKSAHVSHIYLCLLGLTGSSATAVSQSTVPVRPLEAAEAESRPGVVASISGLRAVSSRAVFVNDRVRRRVVMLDERLEVVKIVADTSTSTGRRYGPYATGLFAARGDSTLFLNGSTLSMHLIDSHGEVRRVIAPPRPSDFGRLIGGEAGNPGFDDSGRLVYRLAGIGPAEQVRLGALGRAAPPESAAVVRFDFTARRVDTAAFVRVYTPRIVQVVRKSPGSNGGETTRVWEVPVLHPAPTVDDWAVTADGRIAVVRGLDYHVDFFDRDGRVTSGPKVPFAWTRLTDANKQALLDSSKATRTRLVTGGAAPAYGVAPLPGSVSADGPPVTVTRTVGATTPAVSRAPDAPPDDQYVSSDEVPDYQPVFAAGGVRADADGNVWVRTVSSAGSGGSVYDVLDERGRLVDRVRFPPGSVIAGFAPGGVVFFAQRSSSGLVLKRVRHRLPASR